VPNDLEPKWYGARLVDGGVVMTYVKAYTSERARKFLATSQGRRRLLELYLNPLGVAEESKGSAFQEYPSEGEARAAVSLSRRDDDTTIKPNA
jgi:hypothetical protein